MVAFWEVARAKASVEAMAINAVAKLSVSFLREFKLVLTVPTIPSVVNWVFLASNAERAAALSGMRFDTAVLMEAESADESWVEAVASVIPFLICCQESVFLTYDGNYGSKSVM
jgi:hypothetical protein